MGEVLRLFVQKNTTYKSNNDKINYYFNEEKKISNKDFNKFNLRMENSKKIYNFF